MRLHLLSIFLVGFISVSLFLQPSFAQQPTFGPICEEGVTCTPTQPPPTQPPATSTPKPPPVAGSTQTTLAFLGLGGIFLLAGITSYISLRLDRKVV